MRIWVAAVTMAMVLAARLPAAELLVGWASASITPDRPVALSGQFHTRVSQSVHDPITATALALDNGSAIETGTQLVFRPVRPWRHC